MQQLQKLMGCTESFETESVFPDSDDMEVPEGIPLTTPSVAAAHKGVEAARYALKAARGELLPKLSLSASYGTYYSDAAGAQFKEQIDGNRNPSVSLNLVVPLFSAGKNAAAIALARADIQAQEVKVRQAEEQARFTFEQMRRQCICLQEQIRSCRARVQLCRQRLRDADARYDLGMVSSSDWLDAEKDLAQSECDLIQSRCKYLFQLIILEMYNDGWQE